MTDELPDRLFLVELSQKFRLSWTHYQIWIWLPNADERSFYEIEAVANQWSTRELDRQIASALYDRLSLSRTPDEIKRLATQGQIITAPRDPYILEFLELEARSTYSEDELETAIINKLQHFLLELCKGFLFEARQNGSALKKITSTSISFSTTDCYGATSSLT